MVQWHLRSKRKPSGGKLNRLRKKRRMDHGKEFLETKVGAKKLKIEKVRGGGRKLKLLMIDKVNVADPKTGKVKSIKILAVQDNPANPHYVRSNIITKGAIIKTELGLAKITSRPGQNGIMNAKLIEEKK